MRKKSLPIGVLVMVFVVLLAAAGLSYGYWTDSLEATGTLDTGHMDVHWADAYGGPGVTNTPGAGDCSIWISGETLRVDLDTIQPGFYCVLHVKIVNDGTVPVDLDNFDWGYSSGDDLTSYIDAGDFELLGQPSCSATYINAGDSVNCTGTIGMSPDAGNDTQGLSSVYTLTLDAVQSTTAPPRG